MMNFSIVFRTEMCPSLNAQQQFYSLITKAIAKRIYRNRSKNSYDCLKV